VEVLQKYLFRSLLTRKKQIAKAICFFQLNPPLAEEIHLRWMKSLRDEIRLRRFFWELFFAPFVSKESGVPDYALQNRCRPTEIKLSKPLVHFFFLKPKAQKEKVRKKKNAVLGSFAHCGERQGLCSLDSHPLAWGLLWVRCEHTPRTPKNVGSTPPFFL